MATPKHEPWKAPEVHPAAAKLPMMNDAELEELAADIKKNGLAEPIILWRDNTTAPSGDEGPYPVYLLDGRNRLAALAKLGITDPRRAKATRSGMDRVRTLSALVESFTVSGKGAGATRWKPDINPDTFVLSMNVHRRHLTPAQRRAAIAAYITADPKASNRKVARDLKVDDKTVAAVRKGARNAEIPQIAHRPAERAAAAIEEAPDRSNRAIAQAAGVAESTVREARATAPARKPAARSKRKASARYDAAAKKLQRELDTLAARHLEHLAALTPGDVTPSLVKAYLATLDQFNATAINLTQKATS